MSRKFAPALLVSVIGAFAFVVPGSAAASEQASTAASCKSPAIHTADGCRKPATVNQELNRIIGSIKRTNKLQAVIARVDVGGNRILRRGYGESETGVPATPNMNFRIGSMTIPVLTTAIYQLRDKGRLKLGDPISKWVPGIPRASQVNVRMLMNNTSGYLDWVQGNEPFVDAIHANPFRRWTGNELLNTALDRGFACEPGACFNYAHTNFLLLARILRRAEPGTTVARRLQQRVLRPLGINMTFSRLAPIPGPALGAYTTERGVFEQSTGWSPSWGLGNGMLATASIDNVAKEAKGVLSGRTLSRWSRKNMVKRFAPGIGPDPERAYFAQGLIMVNDWRRQNPFFNGYMGNVAWFPKRRIAISLVATTGLETTAPDGQNVTDAILDGIGSY
ncbi:MAG: serine hydrolase domain-containing protein, partial [Solirubrobacterales bacterium]